MGNVVLVVDIQRDRKPDQVIVEHAYRNGDTMSPTDEDQNIILDMVYLCEALCMLFHAAENDGVKKSAHSLQDCIKHLENGFADASYFASSKIVD